MNCLFYCFNISNNLFPILVEGRIKRRFREEKRLNEGTFGIYKYIKIWYSGSNIVYI